MVAKRGKSLMGDAQPSRLRPRAQQMLGHPDSTARDRLLQLAGKPIALRLKDAPILDLILVVYTGKP